MSCEFQDTDRSRARELNLSRIHEIETFARYFAAQLALDGAPRITNNSQAIINRLCDARGTGIVRTLRINARSKDAMNDPPGFAPRSTWSRSRRGFMTQTPDPASSGEGGGGGFFP